MSERLFLFIQFEFPWELGPPDGRYLMRANPDTEPEHVIVLGTHGARRRPPDRGAMWSAATRAGSRKHPVEPEPEPEPVATARATIVDPVSLSAERQAKAWLGEIDGEREISAAVGALNRVLHFHRLAAADPYVNEVSPEQALVIRAGWGEGEQVADGVWTHAVELPWRGRRGVRRKRIGDRAAALRPQERLAVLLGGRGAALLCEELALRARADLEQGRIAHAAVELRGAYAAALSELPGERREDLAIRIAELRKLQEGVDAQGQAALATGPLDEEAVRHALGRLEAALRARTATGFTLK